MDGLALMRVLIEATGLPTESVELELKKLIAKHGFAEATLTLDQVREIMVDYMHDALMEAKEEVTRPQKVAGT